MQTNFTLAQLADPETARSEHILRKCVHCGFCTATCPTFVLLGDERDSPRGRIYFIKAMLEGDRAPSASEVRHVDRCLSCLSCMTTCPSGVNYMHLVDHGRHHIETRYTRSLPDRLLRGVLAWLMPRPAAFRWAMVLGRLAKPLAVLLPARSADPGGATLPAPLEGDARSGAGPARRPVAGRSAADLSGSGAAAQARGADARLRPAGPGARGQRGDGAAADAPRHRGGERRGLGLLRLLGPAYRQERAGDRARQAQHRGVAARDRRRRSRRHRDQRLGLRHDGEGLRPHVRRRSRCGRTRPARSRASPGMSARSCSRSVSRT